MANRLRICMRICIVGGRAFGKTALVKAVAQIPCFIAKNYRNQKNRDSGMSFDDLAQTRWDDVKDWRFNFTVEEGEKKTDKILSFADYAGEYFEEAYEEPSTGSDADGGNKILRKLGSLIRRIWPWGGHKSDRRRINKFFYHPDGVIIMLPRDFSRKDEKGRDVYKRSIYEDRVLDYLAKLQPGTPVQIVISKWDLNKEIEPKGANEDEVVLSSAFKNCYVRILNCYRNRNGKDYDAGVMAISTKEFLDGEWVCFGDTRYNEAYNVRELFKKLSDAADVARTERLKTDWAQAKWWKRMFVMPWESLSVRRKNSTDGEIRSIFRQSWLRFGGFLVASAIVAFATIVSVAGLTEKFRLDGIDSEIAAATNALPKVTKEKLADRDAQLATNKWTHPMFFIPRLAELKRKQGVLKDAFVKYLEDDLVTQLKNPRVINMSPWDVHPDELDVRASNRLAIVENQIARIPEERLSDKIQSRKIEELSIIANLKADRPLNQALYDIGRTNENAKLRAMDAVYKNSPDKKDVRKEDFVRLKLEIGRLEERVSTTLSNTLNKIDNDNKARDWSANVKRAELKINEISNYLGQVFIPESGMYKKWEVRLAELKSRKADDSHYGPFDQAYQALKRDDLNAIASFKKDYPSEKYPNRKEIYGSLAKQERDLLRKIMEDIGQQELAYEDDKSKSMKWRIGQAASRTNAYRGALGKLRKSDGEYADLSKKCHSNEVWVVDHKKYMDYETDWDGVVTKPETNRVRAIVEFLRNHKEEMFPEYAGRLVEAEKVAKELSAQFVRDCTDDIAVARRTQKGSWKDLVKDAESRVAMIEAVLPSVLESDRPTLEKLIKREKDEIANLSRDGQHYDPFDKAYAELDMSDLNAIACFKKQYPREKYMDRKNVYETLDKKERDLLGQIVEEVKQMEKNYADDENKSMKWRIDQAARRTNEYVVALGKLRKSDGEYDVMDKKRQSTEVWINDHKKYMNYETDWDCVVAKPEAEQVRAIVEFLRSHKKEMYPEYAGRLGEAGEIAKKLSAQFVQDCTNEILGIRGKQSGSWQVHVRDASNRIEKIEAILPSVLDSDKPKLVNLINREKNDIVKWTKNGCFGDRLVRVRQMPKDKVLKGIMEFRKEFNEADFPGHSEDYVALSNKEIKVLGDINTTFTNTLAKIPEEAVTNFQGRLKRSVKIHQAYERALEFIPDDHPASVTYKQGSKNAAEDMERYEKWINLRDEACRLVEFAEDVERKTDDEERQCGQEQIISKVGGFYHRFPKRNFHDDELQEFYGNVKNVLDNAEKAVYSRYQGEDGACIVSSGMSDEERIKITENRRDLCKKYMDLLLPDHSDFWSILSRRKDELSHRLGDASFEKEFKESYAKLKGIIGNDKLSAEERIARINSFLAEYDKPDYTKKAFVKTAIEDLRYLKGNLDILQKFNGLQEELDNLKRPIADNSDDADNLGVYRRRCGDLDVKFQAYERYAVTANMAKKARKQLAGEIKWVRGQLGETSWVGIKKKETAYKENPTKENYDALLRVIKAFDDKKDDNPEHAKGVKDIKEKVEKDWRLAQDVNRKRQEFIDNPNRQTFMYFISRVGNFVDNGYREKNNMSNAYEAFYKQVFNSVHQQANGLAFRWKWLGYNFKDTNLEHWTDYWLELWFDDTRVCEVSDISHDNWNPEIRDYKIHKGNIVGDSYIAPHAALKIKLVHSQSPQKDNEMSVNWYEMLAMGIKFSGEFTYTFYISGNGNKTKRGELLIKFSDLPYLPNGDL